MELAVADTADGVGNNRGTACRMAAKTDTEVDGAYTDTHVEWQLMEINGGGDLQWNRWLRWWQSEETAKVQGQGAEFAEK